MQGEVPRGPGPAPADAQCEQQPPQARCEHETPRDEPAGARGVPPEVARHQLPPERVCGWNVGVCCVGVCCVGVCCVGVCWDGVYGVALGLESPASFATVGGDALAVWSVIAIAPGEHTGRADAQPGRDHATLRAELPALGHRHHCVARS